MTAYIVGIDLGTTHTVVASARADVLERITLFDIAQWIAPGELAGRPLLPSVRYHPAPGELPPAGLPWATVRVRGDAVDPPAVLGELARQLGAQVPGRLVVSAKSWLSHPSADRLAPILPWGADTSVGQVSPVTASASLLAHVRAAWDREHADAPLAQQTVVLTVPASFDEVARTLTLQAAREAGLPTLTLLEEPQAAFQDWLWRHRAALAGALAGVQRVLVCDVGGGTTDFTLIDVEPAATPDGLPTLRRRAVGQHLMLGGDNMDLALAHLVERRLAEVASRADEAGGAGVGRPGGVADRASGPLSSTRLSQLMARCRVAKEQLLAADAPAQVTVTLLGGGSRLIGRAASVVLGREEVQALLIDGFMPRVAANELPRRARSGLVEFGLPYAQDAAITRHLAAFLQQHLGPGEPLPDAVLLNGGVFRAEALVHRLLETLTDWRGGAAPRLLHNDDPDVAVARGAVAHALASQGRAPRVRGGAARSLYLLLDDGVSAGAHAAAGGLPAERPASHEMPVPREVRAVCLLPRGSEPGRVQALAGRRFTLRVGQPVRFHLASSLVDAGTPPEVGALVMLPADEASLHRLPPIATVVPAGSVHRNIAVTLEAALNEVGTLDLHCVAVADPGQRWQLEFQLRSLSASVGDGTVLSAVVSDERLAPRLPEVIAALDRVFGNPPQGRKAVAAAAAPTAREVRALRLHLEQLLGERERWTRPVLRRLFDVLWQRARGRRRSADHERLWLNLAGWCLRPGFGDPLDAWRVEQLWTIFEAGTEHRGDAQVGIQWWTLWRRVAGGLPDAAQLRLLDDFGYNLQAAEHPGAPLPPKPPGLVKGGHDDMVRLGASLERIPPEHKAEVGEWLLQPVIGAAPGTARNPERDELRLWATGRIGARQPFHGSPHTVLSVTTAQAWLESLLRLDWKRQRMAAFAAAQLARRTGDRVRDIDPALRAHVLQRLRVPHLPPSWAAMVETVTDLSAEDERVLFGDALPPGLVLVA